MNKDERRKNAWMHFSHKHNAMSDSNILTSVGSVSDELGDGALLSEIPVRKGSQQTVQESG
jgi:hypothetical protein